jgi:hypothetical protein
VNGRTFETLEEAWEHARQPDVFGEDIAQQAVLLTLARSDKAVRGAAYLLTTCHWLRIHAYSDAKGEQRSDRLKYKREVLLVNPELMREAVDTLSPEKLLLLKEETSGIKEDAVQALLGSYTPQSSPTRCRKGHEGSVYFRPRKSGGVHKMCHICDSDVQRTYRVRRKQKREQGGQASEG